MRKENKDNMENQGLNTNFDSESEENPSAELLSNQEPPNYTAAPQMAADKSVYPAASDATAYPACGDGSAFPNGDAPVFPEQPPEPLELDQERMLALLRSFSTPIDPSNITSTRIESLPASCVHSAHTLHSHVMPPHSAIHSVHNSSSNIHSNLSLNYPPLQPNFLPGSLMSFGSAASGMTPRPSKKYKPPDSDAGTDLLNICRICQLPGDDHVDILFSPCRCSGSLKYVHYSCLMKWIDISTRRTKKTPVCELCHFTYIRHKRFKFRDWRLPRVTRRDKCLHTVFLLTLIVMVTCAVATVLCFLSDNGQISPQRTQLTVEEVVTLTCGVLFFVSFFLAMTVEIKARHTVYRLFLKFVTHNTEWQIEPYDYHKDPDCPKPYLYV